MKIMDKKKIAKKTKKYKYTIVWRQNGVEIYSGAVSEEQLVGLQELRAFNEKKEFRAVFDGEKFIIRIAADNKYIKYVDEIHKLWGDCDKNAFDSGTGYTTLTEDRGVVVKVPFEVPKGEYAFIKVRNYLAKDEYRFTDWRFVDFIVKKAQEAN